MSRLSILLLVLFVFLLAFANRDNGPSLITNQWKETTPKELLLDETVIFFGDDGRRYNHHPQIIYHKGKIIASWSSGIWNEDEPGQVMLMSVSHDDGTTWGEPSQIFPVRAGKYNPGCFTGEGIITVRDSLIAFAGYYDYDKPFEVRQDSIFPKNRNLHDELNYLYSHTEIKISTDEGKTWSDPVVILKDFVPNHRPRQLSTGRWIMPGNLCFAHTDDPSAISGWKRSCIPGVDETYSDDPKGHSNFFEKSGREIHYCEATFYEKGQGKLQAFFRASNKLLGTSWSDDSGASWSEIETTNYADGKNRFEAGRLPDGRYYILNTPPGEVRSPLHLGISSDGVQFDQFVLGKGTWKDQPTRVPGRWKYGRYGYLGSDFGDDKMYIIYTINKEDVAFMKLNLEDLDG